MKRFKLLVLYAVSFGALLTCSLHCGGLSKKKIQEVENRIKVLESKGVPDSIVTDIKVLLYKYATAKKLGNGNDASKITDSVLTKLANAEKWYQDFLNQNKASIESSINSLRIQKQQLKGLHLKDADSIFSVIDSLTKNDLLFQAKSKVQEAASIMPSLLKAQQTALKLKPALIGNWKDIHVVKAEEGNYKYTEITSYLFKSDGSFEGSEERKGQSSPYFKEDWQFLSWGKYDLRGDTIYLFVSREKCPRQVFLQLNVKDHKWVEIKKNVYDSTITDHKKDAKVAFSYIKENFKKSK